MNKRNQEIERIYIEQVKTAETIDYYLRAKKASIDMKQVKCREKISDIDRTYSKLRKEFNDIVDLKEPTFEKKMIDSLSKITINIIIWLLIVGFFIGGIFGLILMFIVDFDEDIGNYSLAFFQF